MAEDKGNTGSFGHSGDHEADHGTHEAPPSPKHHKKDSKKYVAFRSDEDDSSELEVDEAPRKERKKLKKDRSNTFKDKFKSIKVKKREKEHKEKNKEKEREKEKEKEKEKEEKKEKKEKKKHKRSLSSGDSLAQSNVQPSPPASPVFGVKLELAIARSIIADGIELPTIFRQCIYFLEEKGLNQEGLYRVSGIKSKIDELKYMYDHGMKIDLDSDEIDANIVAGLLKQYLRELPSNLLTPRLQHAFDSLIGIKDEEDQVKKMKHLLAELPKSNYMLLSWLFVHLGHVMKNFSETKMNIQNISIVFSPTMNISHGVLYIILMHVEEIFQGVEIAKYVEPILPPKQDQGPKSPKLLAEELAKQEVFLDNLHEQMKQDGANEDEVMEKMWEVQRTVTQLKRRLRTMRRTQAPRSVPEDESLKTRGDSRTDVSEPSEVEKPEAPKKNIEIKPAAAKQSQAEDESRDTDQPKKLLDIASQAGNQERDSVSVTGREEKRRVTRNEEHARILEKCKEERQRQDEHEVQECLVEKPVDETVEKATKHSDEKEEHVTEEVVDADAVDRSCVVYDSDGEHDSDASDDEEIAELLREEFKLKLEQEELMALSSRLKDRIQRELNDVDRLQLEIDEIKKKEDYVTSSASSSEADSSSEDSDSESATDSDSDNSELENILKELQKENEKLENQTVDLVKSLSEENEKCVKLTVQLRMLEECRI